MPLNYIGIGENSRIKTPKVGVLHVFVGRSSTAREAISDDPRA
jgi:hypothetical protein